MLYEEDWDATLELGKGFKVYTAPARHFSGRGLKRNQVQWTSFVLQTPSLKIFIGVDSGYDAHFKDIGKEYGPFDLVILENGQYDKNWKYIHMMPEEVLMAAQDLDASRLLPVHSSKFSISNHDWDAPLKTITELNKNYNIPLLTPMIGEPVYLDKDDQVFSRWWLPQVQ
jgi:L-ascorbate metabolism protein UlaG (beta-lactamase superfamily)